MSFKNSFIWKSHFGGKWHITVIIWSNACGSFKCLIILTNTLGPRFITMEKLYSKLFSLIKQKKLHKLVHYNKYSSWRPNHASFIVCEFESPNFQQTKLHICHYLMSNFHFNVIYICDEEYHILYIVKDETKTLPHMCVSWVATFYVQKITLCCSKIRVSITNHNTGSIASTKCTNKGM